MVLIRGQNRTMMNLENKGKYPYISPSTPSYLQQFMILL